MKLMALQESSPSEDQQTLVDGVPLSQAFRLDPVPFLNVFTDKLALCFFPTSGTERLCCYRQCVKSKKTPDAMQYITNQPHHQHPHSTGMVPPLARASLLRPLSRSF